MEPLAVRRYRSFRRFEALGKLKVTPMIRPGNFDDGLDTKGSSLPALAHARVRSGPSIIITPAVFRPRVPGGLSLIP